MILNYLTGNSKRRAQVTQWVFSIFLLLSTSSVYSQSNSDYLKSLDGEAASLSLDGKTKDAKKSSSQSFSDKSYTKRIADEQKQGGAITSLVPGLSLEQFKAVLKGNYIGSYLFYKRLSNDFKAEVYSFYTKNPDSAKVREKILQMSKK